MFYRPDGRRFLATDPHGHPLHECEWGEAVEAPLTRARLRLDWGTWVGLKPGGLVHETTLNLASKPGWQRITRDDLRAMAAQALRVSVEEVRWFYRDEDLHIDANGRATIRQRKDAFYVLDGGGFDGARFMSCMGAMRWEDVDFLPVVELFKSLLPGTGSAAFELIRGLYDDQSRARSAPRPLHYRGIPAYPSEAAFRLFSNFFTPQTEFGESPLNLFMDPARAHRVTWLPAADPPVRYFDPLQGLCITAQRGLAQKATLAQDAAGVPYVNVTDRRIVPLDRGLYRSGNALVLADREQQTIVTLPDSSVSAPAAPAHRVLSPRDWRAVFVKGLPPVPPDEAFGAVLFYPEDEREIDELAAQPFVADYLQDLSEQDREIGSIVNRAERVFIDNGDAVISTCIPFDRPRDYTASIRYVAYAQRQAQQLWTQCAELQRWDWLQRIRFVSVGATASARDTEPPYDLVYHWVAYDAFTSPPGLSLLTGRWSELLRPGGNAFIVGPVGLRASLSTHPFHISWEESVEALPTFRMHRTILPKARLKAGLTLFHVRRA
ncbi:MAG: hypothetical protein ICV75_07515 [Nitrospiraceae bacterium]|nr:hypothetical protein [Nitrospiraceae bacterium]